MAAVIVSALGGGRNATVVSSSPRVMAPCRRALVAETRGICGAWLILIGTRSYAWRPSSMCEGWAKFAIT